MLEKKCLIIGSYGHQYVACMNWDVSELPNIVDYDIVIVNVRSIKDNFLKRVDSDRIDTLRTLLTRLLISNGSILILSDLKRSVERKGRYPMRLCQFSWE